MKTKEKLRTLKDIENNLIGVKHSEVFPKIKAEAIKWVKMLQKRIEQGIAYDFERSKIEWKAQIDILRIVFNITEEDLK